jgi:hypothetical protein
MNMARYSAFLGRRVEVHYRAGDILLPASGTFVADSGRCVFLEQHLVQHGQRKNFRWEIPYQYIVRLEETKDEQPDEATSPGSKLSARAKSAKAAEGAKGDDALGTAATGESDTPPILPPRRPKLA